MTSPAILPAADDRRAQLESEGWRVVATSFGAQLTLDASDHDRLRSIASAVDDDLTLRQLSASDVAAAMALDVDTIDGYPGGPATRHELMSREEASPSVRRRAFGAFDEHGHLVAMTYLEIDGATVETDFTVVSASWRRRGIGSALKAASVLSLATEGHAVFRTGGSADNEGIIRADERVGYVRDEEWVTLEAPAGRQGHDASEA